MASKNSKSETVSPKRGIEQMLADMVKELDHACTPVGQELVDWFYTPEGQESFGRGCVVSFVNAFRDRNSVALGVLPLTGEAGVSNNGTKIKVDPPGFQDDESASGIILPGGGAFRRIKLSGKTIFIVLRPETRLVGVAFSSLGFEALRDIVTLTGEFKSFINCGCVASASQDCRVACYEFLTAASVLTPANTNPLSFAYNGLGLDTYTVYRFLSEWIGVISFAAEQFPDGRIFIHSDTGKTVECVRGQFPGNWILDCHFAPKFEKGDVLFARA
ncbi:MAG: hypothetical protein WC797_02400 [Candidatus Paceibacterota bacterium]|jgi:hypothetical protein